MEQNISMTAVPSQSPGEGFPEGGAEPGDLVMENPFLRDIIRMQRPVTERDIPELCKLVAAGNKPQISIFAMQLLVPLIKKTTADWEIGDIQNLLQLISVVEHLDLPPESRRL